MSVVPRAVVPAPKIDALTGLRIVAAAGVFLSHVSGTSATPQALTTFMSAGYNGVTLFFTLSGFVLAWNYVDRLTPMSVGGLRSFFVARFARIYPLYLFALTFALVPFIIGKDVHVDIWWHVFALQPWSANESVAFGYNGPGWSIGIEFFLYACFPAVLLPLARASRNTLIVVLIGTVAAVFLVTVAFIIFGGAALPPWNPASAHRWLYRTPLTRLGDFTVGIVAALLIKRGSRPLAWVAYAAQAVGAGSFIFLMTRWQVLNSVWSWDIAYLIPAFLVIWGLAAGPQSPLAWILGTKPMVLLGEASFAFYLLHAPMLANSGIDTITSSNVWILTVGSQFVIILLAAIGAHVIIERPAQRWLRARLDHRKLPTDKLEVIEHVGT